MTNTTSFTPQEIEQFLQQFFDVVGARQYIGARYVPIFGRKDEESIEWDGGAAPYEALTIVTYEGDSYMSRQYVPKGISLASEAYWARIASFNAQIEAYRAEVRRVQDDMQDLESDTRETLARFGDEIEDRVPFPLGEDEAHYGEIGQVLTSQGSGFTVWADPVTPDAEMTQAAVDAWLDDHPEATTTVLDNSVTNAKLVQTGGILSELIDARRGVWDDYATLGDAIRTQVGALSTFTGARPTKTAYNTALLGYAVSNTNRWFLNGSTPTFPSAVHLLSMSAATIQNHSAVVEVWGRNGNVLTRLSNVTITGIQADSWVDYEPEPVEGDYEAYMVSVMPETYTLSASIDAESGFSALRTTDLTHTTLAYNELLTYAGFCVNGYLEYVGEPLGDQIAGIESNIDAIEGFIGYQGGNTDFNTDLGGNVVSSTNRWFLDSFSPFPPVYVNLYTVAAMQNTGAAVEVWGRAGDTLTRLCGVMVTDLVANSWNRIDLSTIPGGYSEYYTSVIPENYTVSCTIDAESEFTALRTPDLTSSHLVFSDLSTFAGLCVNGYVHYESVPIIDRVEALESETGGLPVITVGATNCDYTSIAAAVRDAVSDSTVLVFPGTYTEPIEGWNKTIHIVGIDRDSCIIQNSTANYATPAVEICAGSLRNLTIISDAANPTVPSTDTDNYMRDYCVHIDHVYATDHSLWIDNCRMWNNHRTCIGCGMYDHNTVTISNCEMWSGKPDGFIPNPEYNRRGVLYFHNRQPSAFFSDVTEQLLIVRNVLATCDDEIAIFIGDTTLNVDMEAEGWINEMETRFFDNVFLATDSNDDFTITDIIGGTGFTQRLVNSPASFGNNVNNLNGALYVGQ